MAATVREDAFEAFPAPAFAVFTELEQPGNNSLPWSDANRDRDPTPLCADEARAHRAHRHDDMWVVRGRGGQR